MASGESSSPAGARRQLRLFLREQRQALGLTQSDLARRLDWSLSKVQRIESGDVTVSSSDLKVSLALFGVTDPGEIDRLVKVAKAARSRGWFDEPLYRQYLTPGMMQLLRFELEATTIRVYNPWLMPGLLQIKDYAEAIFDYWQDEVSPEARRALLEVRMKRRQYVLDRDEPPNYHVVLDESVLYRTVGSRKVMCDQLSELLNLMQRSNVLIRIAPLEGVAQLALSHFSVLDLSGDENAILYMEALLSDEIIQVPGRVLQYRARFDRLWEVAFSREATEQAIKNRIQRLLSGPDRDGGFGGV